MFADEAQLALGAINAGAQIAGGVAQNRIQKKIRLANRDVALRNRAYQRTNEGVQQQGIIRDEANQSRDLREQQQGQMEGEGTHGSWQDYSQEQLANENQRRLDALNRQEFKENKDWASEDYIYKQQVKSQRLSQMMQMISSALLQGANGASAASAMTGQPQQGY